MKFIVARDLYDAKEFARVREWPKAEWRYVDSPQYLCGLMGAHVYLVAPWRHHPRGQQIYEELRVRQAAGKITFEEVYDWE